MDPKANLHNEPGEMMLPYSRRLLVAHFTGFVSKLLLAGHEGAGNDQYALSETSRVHVSGQPTWLGSEERGNNYVVLDEQPKDGVITVVDSQGELDSTSIVDHISAPGGAVACTAYGNGAYLATAHYSNSKVTTFRLPINKENAEPFQRFEYSLARSGANATRQNVSHPHFTLVDPTGAFLIIPDLGADSIHVYGIDKDTGKLELGTPIVSPHPGSGPRHAIFYSPDETGKTHYVYVANELANTVNAYRVTYGNHDDDDNHHNDKEPSMLRGVRFTLLQTINSYGPHDQAPESTGLAAIKINKGNLYVTNREDAKFGANNDSVARFSISPTSGELTFRELNPTFGRHPRTMEFSPDGKFLAVANKGTDNLVVFEIDESGAVKGKLADLTIGKDSGLSAVQWLD